MINKVNSHLGLGAFGTFGEPLGFQQVFFFDTLFSKSLDLNTNIIEIFIGNRLYAVKRENINGVSRVCCAIYSYAKELYSNRGGTFIGACVVLQDCELDAEDIYTLLEEHYIATASNPKNVINHTIQVTEASKLEITQPRSFESVSLKIRPSSVRADKQDMVDPNKKYLVEKKGGDSDRHASVITFLEEALSHFDDFDTLYFTFDQPIFDYVRQQRVLQIVAWSEFTGYHEARLLEMERQEELARKDEEKRLRFAEEQRLADEKERERKLMKEREEEARRISEQRSQAREEEQIRFQQEQVHRLVLQQQRSKELTSMNRARLQPEEIDLSGRPEVKRWDFNKSKAWTKGELKAAIKEHNELVNYCLKFEKQVTFGQGNSTDEEYGVERKRRFFYVPGTGVNGKILLAGIVLISALILILLVYILLFKERNPGEFKAEQIGTKRTEKKVISDSLDNELMPLEPLPNNKLGESDVQALARADLKNKPLLDIVALIFKKNPTEISSPYKGQEKAYALALLKANNSCFREENEIYLCTCALLPDIPSYKKGNN